jgi:hypothetical protein
MKILEKKKQIKNLILFTEEEVIATENMQTEKDLQRTMKIHFMLQLPMLQLRMVGKLMKMKSKAFN